MSEKRTTKNLKRLQAAFSVELSLTMMMVTVGAVLILALFGRSLATAFFDSPFISHFFKKQNVERTLVNNSNNTNFTQTQINVALTASQGVRFNTEEDAFEWSKNTISKVLDFDVPAQYDLEALAKAAAVADMFVGVRYVANGKTLSEIAKIINTDKYGNIIIVDDFKTERFVINLNNKKIVINKRPYGKNNNLALFNAIYNAKFE